MDDLVTMLRLNDSLQLEGAMDVITELVREDLGPDQLPTIASGLLPTLLDLLRNPQVCSHYVWSGIRFSLTL